MINVYALPIPALLEVSAVSGSFNALLVWFRSCLKSGIDANGAPCQRNTYIDPGFYIDSLRRKCRRGYQCQVEAKLVGFIQV